METKSNVLRNIINKLGNGMIFGTSILVIGLISYFIKSTKTKYSKDKKKTIKNDSLKSITPIPIQQLERILIKVNNRLIILLANLLDYSKNHEEKCEEETKTNSEFYLKTESDSGNSPRKSNYIKRLLGTKQVYDQITNEEITIVKNNGFNEEQYIYSIQNNNSIRIKKHIEFLVEFRRNIEQNKLMYIDFGDNFTLNYLKIISNIYFINLKKVQEHFKTNYVYQTFFFKNYNQLNNVLTSLYSNYLKETRNEVCEFFGIKNDKLLDIKVLLRLYYYYLKPSEDIRIKIDEYVQILNEILINFSRGYEFPLLEKSSGKPQDEVIELSKILLSKVEFKIELDSYENERIETNNSVQDNCINK